MKTSRLVRLASVAVSCVSQVAFSQASAPPTSAAQDKPAYGLPAGHVGNSQSSVESVGKSAGMEGLDEIVVTARRQAERVQDVPISIIAVDEKTLQEKGVRTANDLPQVAAGLSVQNTSGNRSDTTFSIRGQGQTFGQSSPGVVAYFADVPDFGTQIYDLENIQVLKGPQGTLFGRNTEGGAVLFVPQKPTADFNGFVLTRLGQYARRDVEFGVGGGLLDGRVMFRVSGQMLRRDGYTKNIYNDTYTDNENKKSFRASLVLRPVDWLENYTIYQYSHVDEAGAGVSIGGFDATNLNTAPFHDQLAAQLAAQRARGPRVIDVDYPLSNGMISKGVINTTTLQAGDHLTLKNIFSTRNFRSRNDYELDGTTLPLLQDHVPYTPQTERTEEIQAQARLGILRATVGYFDEKDTSQPAIGFDVIEYINPIGPIHAINYGFGTKNTSKAVYAEATLKPTDSLALTAGIRRTKDFRSAASRTDVIYPFGTVPGTPIQASGTFKATTWNLNALYKFTPDLNAYVTARRGYKSGGFNGTALTVADEFFKPETVTDYEAGVKYNTRFGAWRLRADIDVFHDVYKNIQRYVNLATSPPSTVTRNAASGKISGVDVDVQIAPNAIFDLSVKYTYLYARYDSYTDPSLGDLSNSRFPNSPKSQLNIVPHVNVPVPERIGNITLQGNIYYQSLIAFDPANNLNGNPAVVIGVPGSTAPAYTRYDVRVDWHNVMKSRLSVAAYVRNLTNKVYISGSDNQLPSFAGVVTYLYGEPRMFAVELRYDF